MKKFLVCFAVFAAVFLAVSCGGGDESESVYGGPDDSENQGNPDSDAENTVSDSDEVNAPSDSDGNNISDSDSEQEIPEGDETPDDRENEGKDDGEKPCKDDNPCEEMPNSTGECKIKNNAYICGCEENYTWNGELCMADSRSATCSGLPKNAEWNSVSEIIQVWNGEKWIPSKEGGYCENESESECCFKCREGHYWVDSNCFPECSPTSETPCIDLNTDLIWSAKSENTMHWNDTFEYCANLNEGGFNDWKLPSIKVLNTLVRNCDSASGCEGNTDGFYSEFGEISVLWSSNPVDSNNAQAVNFLDGSTVAKSTDNSFFVRCVRGNLTTRTVKCKVNQEHAEINRFTKIEQTWDWNDMWIPSNIAVFNNESKEGECRFKCNEGYGFNGSVCVDKEGLKECDGTQEGDYLCKDLVTGYFWSNPSNSKMEWSSAKTYCSGISDGGFHDWRLPTVSELRTVIKNCPKTETGGTCRVTDTCTKNECYVKENCSCDQSDIQGYYSKLNFSADYWSSTFNATVDNNSWNWYVDFKKAELMDCKNGNAFLESSASHKVVCIRK